MPNLLEVKGLKKYFKTQKGFLHAVDDVSFSIRQGCTLGVVGESGCGKSTLGRTVLHLIERSSGEIRFEDRDISSVSGEQLKALRKDMQMIFQDPYSSLNPRMPIHEIVSEPLVIYDMYKSRAELYDKVRELMDAVGLSKKFAYLYPHELDGGRRQRVGIARALALGPKFIVCDEPVSALDVSIQAQILNLMQDLQEERNLTYMFITHNLSVVRHISDEIIVMYLGNMVEYCETEELFLNPLHPYTKALLSAIPSVDIDVKRTREVLKGELSSPINPKPGCRFAARCSRAQALCNERNPELTEIDMRHFVACHYV